jgi:transcriptional regulator CtsR
MLALAEQMPIEVDQGGDGYIVISQINSLNKTQVVEVHLSNITKLLEAIKAMADDYEAEA